MNQPISEGRRQDNNNNKIFNISRNYKTQRPNVKISKSKDKSKILILIKMSREIWRKIINNKYIMKKE